MQTIPLVEAITAEPLRAVRRPVMLQSWNTLAALHWRYEPAEVQRLLPHGFTVDTFDEAAWVGLLPFHMQRIRVPGMPPFGRFSTFPETNVRTYIVDPNGRRGVWFFCLEASRLLPVLVARATYQLPYCWSRMSIDCSNLEGHDQWEYRSTRRWPERGPASHITVRVGPAIPANQVTVLDHFLTARWALGSTFGKRCAWAKVSHPEWVLHEAEATGWHETLFTAVGLSKPIDQPLVRWSPGVDVAIQRPRLLRRHAFAFGSGN